MTAEELQQLLDNIAEESEMREKNTDNYDEEWMIWATWHL